MKTEFMRRLEEIKNITNIFDKEKKHIKLKSLLKILSKYHPDKVMKYKKNLAKEKSGG